MSTQLMLANKDKLPATIDQLPATCYHLSSLDLGLHCTKQSGVVLPWFDSKTKTSNSPKYSSNKRVVMVYHF